MPRVLVSGGQRRKEMGKQLGLQQRSSSVRGLAGPLQLQL